VRDNGTFCWDWARDHWDDTLQPRLIEHIQLTLYAVGIGFVIALAAALIAYRFRWFEGGFGLFAAFLYTIPSLALFQLLVPITGLTVTTVEVALVGYTLLILFRNILAGLRSVPPDVLEAARGMGYTRRQTLLKVELPLAVPSILAGVRIATVTTISLATIAAFILPEGLGQPILDGLATFFKTKFIAAGALAVALALVAV
jgi:osmoprotectant transport system permease protein